MKTVSITNYYTSRSQTAQINQATYALTAPATPTTGAAALSVLGAVSMAVLAAAF